MKTLDLGNVTVDKIVENEHMWLDPFWLFHNIDQPTIDRNLHWMQDFLFDGAANRISLSFHSFLIRAGGRNILVDTCVGNHKERPGTPFWNQLKTTQYMRDLSRHGLTPADIHMVMCTHLHVDHVGWNTQLDNGRWVPTFPNARYIFGRAEFDGHAARQADTPDTPINRGSWADSVLPVVEAGLAELVEYNFTEPLGLEERVTLLPTPGHTPGHFCINVEGRDDAGLITGDAIHHPIQLREPHLVNNGDMDVPHARRTREALIRQLAESGQVMLPCHFAGPTAGRIRDDGAGLHWFDFLG